MKAIIFFIAIISLLLTNCSEQETFFNIEPELQQYVDSFYKEANDRGIVLQRSNLIGKVSKSISPKQGLLSVIDGQIIMEINYYSFKNFDKNKIEAIVFHELGHGLLKRNHCDEKNSLMNTSVCLNCFSLINREYYLEELFHPR